MNSENADLTSGASEPGRKQILFAGRGTAILVMPFADDTVDSMVSALGIETPRAIFLIFGGAGEMPDVGMDRLTQLIREGLIPVARARHALLIDGGTDSGVMAIVGQAVGRTTVALTLLGVAPYGLVSFPDKPLTSDHQAPEMVALEPHHTHFILPPGEIWGSETGTLIKVAATLAHETENPCPVVGLLINGGKIAIAEAYACVQHGWPLIVLEGSGRAADEIAKAYNHLNHNRVNRNDHNHNYPDYNPLNPITTDARIAEIVELGNLILFPASGTPQELHQLLLDLGV